jgi:hypothetical protein
MRSISTVTVATGALVVALTFAAAPVAAGPVCDELDLDSPCVRSNDIRPNIALGGATGDARLRLRNADGATAVDLRSSNGNLTNLFSNAENESNGLVKAWARINADGTILACWRCNRDTNETRRLVTSQYEVDFTPLATDISGRPRLCVSDGDTADDNICTLDDITGDTSSVFVVIIDADTGLEDGAFTIMIF